MKIAVATLISGAMIVVFLFATATNAQQLPPGLSLTCQFTYGPKAGQIETFHQAWPIPIGSQCTDRIASSGVAIAPPPPTIPKKATASVPSAGGELRSPVNGTWRALQAPPCPNPTNHHCGTPNQQFAYDLVYLNQFGQPTSCIGQPVFSPSTGTIEHTTDGFPNHSVPNQHLAGNHVVIRRSANEYILIAHFSPGTISVYRGDTVTVGQQLGVCGNSGQSSFSHVHVHMQNDPNPLYFQATGEPMIFTSVGIHGPRGCVTHTNHLLKLGQTICSR